MSHTVDHVILVPGLLEPHFAFWPLRHRLRRPGVRVDFFADRLAFRKIDDSIGRLTELIEAGPNDRSIGVVTHSFGDWVARQAIAQASNSRVSALVSVAPVMRAGFLPAVVQLVSGNLIPEIKIIMDRDEAAKNIDCDDSVARLVLWARFDECLRSVDLDRIRNLESQQVVATHLSIVLQPNVISRIESFLFPSSRPCGQSQNGT
jgi:hypothetical protein